VVTGGVEDAPGWWLERAGPPRDAGYPCGEMVPTDTPARKHDAEPAFPWSQRRQSRAAGAAAAQRDCRLQSPSVCWGQTCPEPSSLGQRQERKLPASGGLKDNVNNGRGCDSQTAGSRTQCLEKFRFKNPKKKNNTRRPLSICLQDKPCPQIPAWRRQAEPFGAGGEDASRLARRK